MWPPGLSGVGVIWPEPEPLWVAGQPVWLSLGGHGVSVLGR
ncbi:MAG TPA: hypothetical protein VFZ28_18555 [Burkholderiaceae bacterium]|nr:hypothetical protein [Burkholderiaceae bacterium]